MPRGVTVRHAKGQEPIREGPPPAASPACPLTQAFHDISVVRDPCAMHSRDICETKKVGAVGSSWFRGPDGAPTVRGHRARARRRRLWPPADAQGLPGLVFFFAVGWPG